MSGFTQYGRLLFAEALLLELVPKDAAIGRADIFVGLAPVQERIREKIPEFHWRDWAQKSFDETIDSLVSCGVLISWPYPKEGGGQVARGGNYERYLRGAKRGVAA